MINFKPENQHLPSEQLFILSEQFRDRKLWEDLCDLQLFAVQYGKEILYCCVMGEAGMHFALAVYPGKQGLMSYAKLHTMGEQGKMTFERAFAQDCVQCSFEDRKELNDRDYTAILCRGRKYRGKKQWPQFRRYRPLRYPWCIDADDEAALIAGLKASLYMGELLRSKTYESMCGKSNTIAIPLLKKLDAGYRVSVTNLPTCFDEHFTSPRLSNDLEIAKLKRTKTDEDTLLQCTITCMPTVIEDENGGAPYVPLLFCIISLQYFDDNGETMTIPKIEAMETALDYESGVGLWMSCFCQYIEEHGKPLAVITNENRTDHLLSGICKQIGIKYKYNPGAPLNIDEVVEDMFEQFGC